VPSPVKFLRFANAVTALEGGTTVPVPPGLMALKGRSASFDLLDSEGGIEALGSSEDDESAGRDSNTVLQPVLPSADPDLSRQGGDSSLYKMYLRSVGWAITAAFVVIITIDMAISKMPRLCFFSICFKWLSDSSFRDLAATLDGTRDNRR